MKITLGQALAGFLIISILTIFFSFKIAGASNLPVLIEKDGYCKTMYGEDWDYSEIRFDCFNTKGIERISFTKEEFREVCPKNKLLSTRFSPVCFVVGDPR